MKKMAAIITAALIGLCMPASAVEFTLSKDVPLPASGTYGSATAVDLGGGTIRVTINMDPNLILDTGNGHMALTLSLLGAGRIDNSTIDALNRGLPADTYNALAHLAIADYKNSPFGDFTDAIAGNCGNGSSSGGCGSTLVFDITNFAGFAPATNMFDPPPAGGPTFQVFAAVDISWIHTGRQARSPSASARNQ